MVNNVYYEIGASEVYGGITTLAVVAAIAVVLRMVARRVAAASYWWGDLSIVVALVSVAQWCTVSRDIDTWMEVLKWALTACYYAELHHSGLGRHTRAIGGPVTESQLELYFKVNCSFTALAVRFEEDWSIAQEMGTLSQS